MANENNTNDHSHQTSLVIAGKAYETEAVDLTSTDRAVSSMSDLAATVGGIKSFLPLGPQPKELSMDIPVRVTLQLSSFTAHSDWLGTRVVSAEPHWSDPLFAESLANRYAPEDFMTAVRWLMSKGRSHELAKMFGIPAHTRIFPKSISPAQIFSRMAGASDVPAGSAGQLAAELLVSVYKFWDITSPSTRRAAITQPKSVIPSREHLRKRAHVYRILSAMKEIRLPAVTTNDERVAGNLDGMVSTIMEGFLESLYRASNSENYVDLTMEAIRARLLRETMPHLPPFILDDPDLQELARNGTLVLAALSSSSAEFRINFAPMDETMSSATASAHYAAYAAFLPQAVQFVKAWLAADPGLTTVPMEAALQATEVQRVLDVGTQTIRGGVIRTILRDIDQSPTIGIMSHDREYGFFLSSTAYSSAMGQAATIAALDPMIGEKHTAQLAAVMAAILNESPRSMISVISPDHMLLQFAAMAAAEEVFIQASVPPEAMDDYRTKDLNSSYTVLYRHKIEGALGFTTDVQAAVLNSVMKADSAEGLPGVRVTVTRPGESGEPADDGSIVEVDTQVAELSQMTMRVGSSAHVYSVDPRVVLLALGDRSATKPWEVGVHRLDYRSLNRVYVRGMSLQEANIARPIIYTQMEVGRHKKLSIKFQLTKLAQMVESERAYLQPVARLHAASYFTLLKQIVDASSESRGNPLVLQADLRRRFRSMVASRLLWQIEQYYGVGQQSRVVAIIRAFAAELQRAGALSVALNRYPEDDRRLVLFLLQAIFTASALFLSGAEVTNTEDEIVALLKEVITSDEFRDGFFVSPLAASIQL